MRFSARYALEWDEVVGSDAFKRKRREITKRCRDILSDPKRAHNAHPYRDQWEGFWGAYLDDVNRIMYTIDEEEGLIVFYTIFDPHH